MLSTDKKVWTYDEYYKLNDGNQYEVINGELKMVPAPDLSHQDISREIEFKIYNYINGLNLGKVYNAPVDVILDEKLVVQPDLIFISKENFKILKRRGIFGSPDLIVEIISKYSVKSDRHEKFKLYEKYLIKEYWIVDPSNKTIEAFYLENNKYELFYFADLENKILGSKVLEGLEISVDDIFITEEDITD